MKLISLKNSNLQFMVDDENYARVIGHNWFATFNGNGTIKQINGTGKSISISRFILRYNGPLIVDHIDRNPLNNQKLNLRICTQQINLINRSQQKGSSRYRGVSRIKNRWRAQINHNNGTIYIGTFLEEADAAKEYNKFALKLRGEFAVLNKIDAV